MKALVQRVREARQDGDEQGEKGPAAHVAYDAIEESIQSRRSSLRSRSASVIPWLRPGTGSHCGR